MGRAEQETYRSKLFNFKGMFDVTGKHTKSLSVESATLDAADEATSKSKNSNEDNQNRNANKHGAPRSRLSKEDILAREAKEREAREKLLQEMEQMKERFAKLLYVWWWKGCFFCFGIVKCIHKSYSFHFWRTTAPRANAAKLTDK